MPLQVKVDAEAKLVRAAASGILTLEDVLGAIAPMFADPAFETGMPQLFDATAAENTSLTADQMRRIMAAFQKEAGKIGGSRLAIVATRPVLYGMSRMYEALASEFPGAIGVFGDVEEALAWLRVEAPPADAS